MSAGVAVAVSGGRDSMALLHCTAHAARRLGLPVWALHVHHGLQPQADEWAAFVERTCKRWAANGLDLRFTMRRLDGRPARGQSVEAWARAGRYRALGEMATQAACSLVLLGHHQGDQAETFLLQALRGGGAAGLAAMPASLQRDGLTWARPWLDRPRREIEDYVRAHRIRHVDDASNDDRRFARNRLRLDVMPVLRQAFGDADAALTAASRRAAHERALIAEVAQADLALVTDGAGLSIARWQALSPARRHEVLRAWLEPQVLDGVPESLLDRLGNELAGQGPASWPCGALSLRRYRGCLTAQTAGEASDAACAWPCDASLSRAGLHRVPGVSAALRVRAGADGLPRAVLQGARWQARQGGERFQLQPGRPPRSLKKQFQAAGVPAWARAAPLLVAADGTLLFVPGLGIDARALALPGRPRVSLEWLPDR
jgi:tRNA(Ile)-lysidine synthase